eukprot:CAMPEP_0169163050 /NCGR_PEP_ID=MMETSP1015-20121227/58040_1 /TAXON_ID=342587 /ORGANISM="Karlodinium micrum, Strain CCMP2283" /LENGTH=66 /DNA_ID=CAMNT_0009235285 /DNA_START=406 /DNA_END=602 /DNA_ORIENTATION=-
MVVIEPFEIGLLPFADVHADEYRLPSVLQELVMEVNWLLVPSGTEIGRTFELERLGLHVTELSSTS